jgi:hypothetical protein
MRDEDCSGGWSRMCWEMGQGRKKKKAKGELFERIDRGCCETERNGGRGGREILFLFLSCLHNCFLTMMKKTIHAAFLKLNGELAEVGNFNISIFTARSLVSFMKSFWFFFCPKTFKPRRLSSQTAFFKHRDPRLS